MDTLGPIWALVVTSAAVQDNESAGAGEMLWRLMRAWVPRMRLVWADSTYRGLVGLWVQVFGWALALVRRPDGTGGFTKLPRRWVVERTFAWLGRYRRLSKDYEQDTGSSETMILLAVINLMLHRLRPG